ncbi:MAG: hypothetical protein ACI867_002234, partial [Glaciecola sp.]
LSAFILEPTGSLPGAVMPSIATTREAGADWFVTSEGLPDTITMAIPDFCQRTCGMTGTTDGDDMNVVWWTEPSGVSVYWTLSGGRSYTARSVPSTPLRFDFRTEAPASEMVTDDPGYLGLFGSRDQGAAVSDDGGRTWNSWPEHFNDFSSSLFAFPDEARGQALDRAVDRYLVAELDQSGALLATHAKYQDVLGWLVAPAQNVTGQLTALTSVGDASLLLATTTDGIWLGQQSTLDTVRWQSLVTVPGLRHAQAAGALVWMHDDTSVRVIEPGVLPLLLGVPPLPPSIADLELPPFDPANPIGPLPGTLATADRTVRVTPGEAVDVALLLDVPALKPKLDLMFLVARNGSMDDELDELTDEFFFILKQLQDRKVNVNVGIGVYGSQVRYHRYRDIGPANDRFKKIVDDINGFGRTLSAFTAIDAAMAGTIYPVSGDKFATYKGLEAHWRANSTRIVLHVADAVPFGNSDDATPAVAHAALQEVGALHLGLIVGGRGATDWSPMDELARASGALATKPVDCNGDGITDLEPGDPLVCEYQSDEASRLAGDLGLLADFATVIVDALDAATAISPLSFHTTTPSLVTSFAAIAGTTQLDLLQPTSLPSRASITCSQDLAGTVTTTRLSVASGTRGLATTTLEIICGELPVALAAPIVAAAAIAPDPAVAAEPALLNPVPPVVAPAPLPVANAPASSNVMPNSAVAGAEQREEQFQQAMIGKGQSQQEPSAEFAFSALRPRQDRSAPATLVIGAAMALGAAGALARQRQQVCRPVRVR